MQWVAAWLTRNREGEWQLHPCSGCSGGYMKGRGSYTTFDRNMQRFKVVGLEEPALWCCQAMHDCPHEHSYKDLLFADLVDRSEPAATELIKVWCSFQEDNGELFTKPCSLFPEPDSLFGRSLNFELIFTIKTSLIVLWFLQHRAFLPTVYIIIFSRWWDLGRVDEGYTTVQIKG